MGQFSSQETKNETGTRLGEKRDEVGGGGGVKGSLTAVTMKNAERREGESEREGCMKQEMIYGNNRCKINIDE